MLDALVHTLADKEYYAPPATEATSPAGPSPAEIDADPVGCLERFSENVAAGLLAMADPGRPDWVFPPSPQAFASNTVCVAYGTAGVVHALHRAGVSIPDDIEKRLRRDALAGRDELPPGLDVGTAGIARVLATLGRLDEAIELVEHAEAHPITASCSTLAGGRAGVGLTWLALHRLTRDVRHLEKAAAAGDAIAALVDRGADELIATLGPSDARGLHHGRSGLAQFLHHLAQETDDERYRAVGVRLLHEELDRAIQMDDGTLSFADDAVTCGVRFLGSGAHRFSADLSSGGAGVLLALRRFLDGPGGGFFTLSPGAASPARGG